MTEPLIVGRVSFGPARAPAPMHPMDRRIMTEPLDPEIKRLRRLSPGELADEVGGLKAQIADLEAALLSRKTEAIRRGIEAADGQLFHLTLTPPTQQLRIDGATIRRVMGDQFADHFSRACDSDWVMRCFARPRGNSSGPAAIPARVIVAATGTITGATGARDNYWNYHLTKAAE